CFLLPFYDIDFHHTVLGLHHQLLGREVVDIQAHLPVVLSLLMGHHGVGVHHGSGVHHGCHFRGQDGGPQVPRPVGAGECAEVLGQSRHTEGLVEDAAALLPVTEWVPAGGAEQSERNTSLSHDDTPFCVLAWKKHVVFRKKGHVSECREIVSGCSI
uniref:Uncharacterized protein n=1 Tax=Stegastes partitus TaxID=144197 RepID=A0A3B5ARL8_9TELE